MRTTYSTNLMKTKLKLCKLSSASVVGGAQALKYSFTDWRAPALSFLFYLFSASGVKKSSRKRKCSFFEKSRERGERVEKSIGEVNANENACAWKRGLVFFSLFLNTSAACDGRNVPTLCIEFFYTIEIQMLPFIPVFTMSFSSLGLLPQSYDLSLLCVCTWLSFFLSCLPNRPQLL